MDTNFLRLPEFALLQFSVLQEYQNASLCGAASLHVTLGSPYCVWTVNSKHFLHVFHKSTCNERMHCFAEGDACISWLFHAVHWCDPLFSSSFHIGGLWLPAELWMWRLKFHLNPGDKIRAEPINGGPWCWQLEPRLGLDGISAGPSITAGLALLRFPYAFEIR